MRNQGYESELKLVNEMNGKRFVDLNNQFQRIVRKMYPSIQKEDVIFATKYDFHAKPDIEIVVNEEKKYVSLKTGNSKYIHSEGIKSLILFLRSNGLSTNSQKTILYFHYGDTTLDGSGKTSYPFYRVYLDLRKQIEQTNYEINSNKSLLVKVMNRFLFKGDEDYPTKKVDFLVYMDHEDLYIASRAEIEKEFLTLDYTLIRTIHFGPVTIRPYVRNANNEKNRIKRNVVQANWPNLSEVIRKLDRK